MDRLNWGEYNIESTGVFTGLWGWHRIYRTYRMLSSTLRRVGIFGLWLHCNLICFKGWSSWKWNSIVCQLAIICMIIRTMTLASAQSLRQFCHWAVHGEAWGASLTCKKPFERPSETVHLYDGLGQGYTMVDASGHYLGILGILLGWKCSQERNPLGPKPASNH